MKKILFICYMDLKDKGTIGIRKKIISQISTLSSLENCKIDYICREGYKVHSNIEEINGMVCNNADSLNSILLNKVFLKYNYCYVRYNRFSLRFVNVLRKIKKNGCKTILEIPTYPFFQEDWDEFTRNIKKINIINSAKIIIKIFENIVFSKYSKRYIDRVATYSKDTFIWNIKTLKISNGIKIERFEDTQKKHIDDNITLICVSSCLKWHGYDRLLNGIANYYKKSNNSKQVKVIIVGDGPELDNYRNIIRDNMLDDYVLLKGAVYGDELNELYSMSDIAIDALGRHRVGVYYNSSLKGKEYAERGLPIVSGVETEFDKDHEYLFYYRVPADDSPIEINELIDFYNNIKKIDDYQTIIHTYASEKFSYKKAMESVINYILID